MYTNIIGLKRQLNIEKEYTEDDAILQTILDASESAVVSYCNAIIQVSGYTSGSTGTTSVLNLSGATHNISMSGYAGAHTDVSVAVQQATYLVAANLYVNRSIVSFAQGVEIPYTLQFLLCPYKNFVIV
jgi:hypothetical protein